MTTTAVARRCESCGAPLPLLARSNRRFCDTTCRVAAHEKRQSDAGPLVETPAILTANTYTHVLVDEIEIDHERLLRGRA